jgi:hypothetical protein
MPAPHRLQLGLSSPFFGRVEPSESIARTKASLIRLPCALIRGARCVAVDHLPALPACKPHKVSLGSPVRQPSVGEGVPQLMWVDFEADGSGPVADRLIDAVAARGACRPEPELRPTSIAMLRAQAEVSIDRLGRLGAERDGTGAATLAYDPTT